MLRGRKRSTVFIPDDPFPFERCELCDLETLTKPLEFPGRQFHRCDGVSCVLPYATVPPTSRNNGNAQCCLTGNNLHFPNWHFSNRRQVPPKSCRCIEAHLMFPQCTPLNRFPTKFAYILTENCTETAVMYVQKTDWVNIDSHIGTHI